MSLEASSVCVVDGNGKIACEVKIVSGPDDLIACLTRLKLELARIGLEAGPLSQWLYAAMHQVGLAVELLDMRHVRDALEAMPVKTDCNEARGITQLTLQNLTHRTAPGYGISIFGEPHIVREGFRTLFHSTAGATIESSSGEADPPGQDCRDSV